MPDEAPPTIEPTREPICEKCGGALEQLTRLPKFDHPTFDIFRCLACGVVSWIAQEDEASVAETSRSSNRVKLGVYVDERTARALQGIVGKRLTECLTTEWPYGKSRRKAKKASEED